MDSTKRPASGSTEGPSKAPRTEDLPSDRAGVSSVGTFICTMCDMVFTDPSNLRRHKRTKHGDQTFTCELCTKIFRRSSHLDRHLKIHEKIPPCPVCSKTFSSISLMQDHKKIHDNMTTEDSGAPAGCRSALKNAVTSHYRHGSDMDKDLPTFLQSCDHRTILQAALQARKALKFFITAKIKMIRHQDWMPTDQHPDQEQEVGFTSRCQRVLQVTDIDPILNEAYDKIIRDLGEWQRDGSGWVIDHIISVEIVVVNYNPLKGSSYVELPGKVRNTGEVVNVHNHDQKCFLWAVLSALHPAAKNECDVETYLPFEHELITDNLEFPIHKDDIPKFEEKNRLRINLFGFEDDEVYPIYVSEFRTFKIINLLLISNGETQHYCWIRNFDNMMYCMELETRLFAKWRCNGF